MAEVKLFGNVFESVGSSSSNLLLKSKGPVKVQWGNKFIDLIKDGKINFPKESVQKMIEDKATELKAELIIPANAILLYEGTEAPESWTKVDLDTGIEGYIYIKKMN